MSQVGHTQAVGTSQDIVAAESFAHAAIDDANDLQSQAHVAAEQFSDGGASVAVPDVQAIVEPGQIRVAWNKGPMEPRSVKY